MTNVMSKTKRIVALLLALLMLLSVVLVSCDESYDDDDDDDDETYDKSDKDDEKAELSRGAIDGDVYRNEYLGFEFEKPKSWVYATDEEIASAINMGAEVLLGDNFKEALENSDSIYDMWVRDIVTGSNINVGYENLSKTFSSNITEEQYIEALKKQLESVSAVQVVFPDELETVRFGDTEFTRAVCSTTMSGMTVTQAYYLKKVDKYMAFVVATIQGEYTVSAIESMFK